MSEKVKLYDQSKCTGCRGCQLACKQWNQLPAKQTTNRGSYQNPPDLQPNTWMVIHFQELETADGGVKWVFRKDACMHCTDAACVTVCPSGCLHYTKYGTVALDQKKCIGCKECISACPFSVPRYNPETDTVFKCDMCFSRIDNNMEPACVKACPTGALQFGDKDEMIARAHARAKELGGDASVYGDRFVGGTHMIYVLTEKPAALERLPEHPTVPASVIAWKKWLKPLSLIGAGAVIAGSFLHYITVGPKMPDDDETDVTAAKGGK